MICISFPAVDGQYVLYIRKRRLGRDCRGLLILHAQPSLHFPLSRQAGPNHVGEAQRKLHASDEHRKRGERSRLWGERKDGKESQEKARTPVRHLSRMNNDIFCDFCSIIATSKCVACLCDITSNNYFANTVCQGIV